MTRERIFLQNRKFHHIKNVHTNFCEIGFYAGATILMLFHRMNLFPFILLSRLLELEFQDFPILRAAESNFTIARSNQRLLLQLHDDLWSNSSEMRAVCGICCVLQPAGWPIEL
jgi:hypothetical protein